MYVYIYIPRARQSLICLLPHPLTQHKGESEEGNSPKLTFSGKVTPKTWIPETDDVFLSTLKEGDALHVFFVGNTAMATAACVIVSWGC